MSAVKVLEDLTNCYRLVRNQWNNVPVFTLKKASPITKPEANQASREIELYDGRRLTITITESI
jgi:hypothetical protein